MELLGIHVYLEFQMRLIQSVNLEYRNSALIINDISFMFTSHLGLSLFSCQLIVLIPLKMSLKSLLHNLLHLLFHSWWVSYRFFSHYLHIVTELHFWKRDRHETKLYFLLLILFFVKALHSSKSFLLLFSKMNRNYHLINSFNLFILNLLWMLNVMSDLFHEYVRLINISCWKLLWSFSFWSLRRKKLCIPPFNIRNWVKCAKVCCLS